MTQFNTAKRIAKSCGVGLIALVTLGAGNVMAEEETIGSDEYRMSCLSCHGVGGRGDGPLAKFLTPKPTDLTAISRNSTALYPSRKAGEFPFLRVFQVIDGRAAIEVHGDRAMPVWGNRYLMDQPGTPRGYAGEYEKVVRGRILELVYYIQSIQQ